LSNVKRQKFGKGFSLVEVLVAVFLFSLTITMLMAAFSGFLKNQINAKRNQRDIENAQYAMNLMAKTLRTSKIVDTSNPNFPLNVYDYSQGKCLRYIYNAADKRLQYYSSSPGETGNPDTCNYNTEPLNDLTSNNIVSAFVVATASDEAVGTFGKVTVALNVRDHSGTTSVIPIQMSVSSR
jgi:prepilin-type N-terminal cleavage/methylation domain-containing protein